MANAGFSAQQDFFGLISGLSATGSRDGRTNSVAQASNSCGDTVAHDVYGEVIAPHVDYAVVGSVDLSALYLGKVFAVTDNGIVKKVMLSRITVTTAAGTAPTVGLDGVQVEANAQDLRLYALSGTLTPRHRAQDVAGAFVPSAKFTSIATTASVTVNPVAVTGVPVASDCFNGVVEVRATMTDPDGTGSVAASQSGGFTVTAIPAKSATDGSYVSIEATATKFLAGVDQEAA